MYKLIIFDLDGTLLNTLPDIYAVLNASLKRFSLPEITLQQTKSYIGNGAEKLVRRAVGESKLFEEVYADYSKNFSACANESTGLFDGEEQALKAFKEAGLKLAVITNKPQRATDNVVNKFFGDFGFDFVIGQSENNPLKPNPASTLKIIDALGLDKSACLFVGDGETDVLTAHNAGVDCVSVLWGYRDKDELEKAGASRFAKNWDELKELVING